MLGAAKFTVENSCSHVQFCPPYIRLTQISSMSIFALSPKQRVKSPPLASPLSRSVSLFGFPTSHGFSPPTGLLQQYKIAKLVIEMGIIRPRSNLAPCHGYLFITGHYEYENGSPGRRSPCGGDPVRRDVGTSMGVRGRTDSQS